MLWSHHTWLCLLHLAWCYPWEACCVLWSQPPVGCSPGGSGRLVEGCRIAVLMSHSVQARLANLGQQQSLVTATR